MRSVRLARTHLEAMAVHARATYPDECCGFLVANPDPGPPEAPRTITAVEPAANEFEGVRRRRFLLRPEELRAAESRLERTGRIVAGFYHSHPDHPALPSTFDRDHAWPWYTYLVVGVTPSGVSEIRAFELDPDRGEFVEAGLAVAPVHEAPAMRGSREARA